MTSRLTHVLLAVVMAAGSEEYRSSEPSWEHSRVSTDGASDSFGSGESRKGRGMKKSKGSKPNVLVAMTGACLIASCAGARVLPDGTGACSPEAIAETRRLNIPPNSYFSVEVLGLPGSVGDVALIREGPIEVRVTGPVHAYVPDEIANSPLCTKHSPDWVVPPECKGKTIVTGTALLYGEASLKGDRVQIRLHQLRDRGMIGPFCGVVAQRRSLSMLGLEKNPLEALRMLGRERPPPGTVAVWSDAEVLIVEDESQKPTH